MKMKRLDHYWLKNQTRMKQEINFKLKSQLLKQRLIMHQLLTLLITLVIMRCNFIKNYQFCKDNLICLVFLIKDFTFNLQMLHIDRIVLVQPYKLKVKRSFFQNWHFIRKSQLNIVVVLIIINIMQIINLSLILYQILLILEELINQINQIENRIKRNQIDLFNIEVGKINKYYYQRKSKIFGQ